MRSELVSYFLKYTKAIADTRIFFFSLLWLCFLVVAGTLAQANMGLYQAQEIYFSSFVLWLWLLPLPGGYTTMGIIFFGLLAKLIYNTEWRNPKKLGTIIAHLGALLLLFGGFLTAVFSTEGNMVIPEGDTVGYVSDYHSMELAIIDMAEPEFDFVTAFSDGWLKKGKVLKANKVPFEMIITDYCVNCRPIKRKTSAPKNHIGLSNRFDITPIPLAKEASENRAAVEFQIISKQKEDQKSDQENVLNYLVLENMAVDQHINFDNKQYTIQLRKEQRPLPFKIELLDFIKEEHPGTSMPSAYSSEVNVIQEDTKQRVVISMNHPLRQGDYTFYQASFIRAGNDETSVLAVVDNVGRLFPYISSLIMSIGLLIHMLIKMPVLFNRGNKNNEK